MVEGYNAFSPSGDVSGDVVYANYGLPQDYAELEQLGVDVDGKIVLVRYGGSFRGVKAQQAEKRGAKGVLIYSDPEDDGYKRGQGLPRRAVAPGGRIQRGSIQYIFNYPGDPLTPGAPAIPGTRRLCAGRRGQPAAHPDHADLLRRGAAAAGRARRGAAPERSRAGSRSPTTSGRAARRCTSSSTSRYAQTPVRDVLVTIRGTTKPDEKVVLGAHYDGWTYGTSDDTSGWTTMMEVGRSLGRLLDRGWRPERTIVIAGWDGEEYGLFGSTEYAEENRKELLKNAVSYANLDGAGGKSFDASGVPQLDDAIIQATQTVTDPRTGAPVYDTWKGDGDAPEVGRLGSGSDYTAFLDHLGVPSFEAGLHGARQRRDVPLGVRRHVQHGALPRPGLPRARGVGAARRHGRAAARQLRRAAVPLLRLRGGRRLLRRGAPADPGRGPGAEQVDLSMLAEAAQDWGDASSSARGARRRAAGGR